MKDGTTPTLYEKSSEDIFNFLCRELGQTSWQKNAGGLKPGAGQTMALLFARLAEILITRLNQVPENHFLAFLDEAGIDLLPPQPARTDITFFPGKDAPEVIHIPSGTQVSAKKSESRPEIIFETERDCTVARTELTACIVADPVRVSDRTGRARGEIAGSFDVFRGEEERERILYIENPLFNFPDPETRKNSVVTLSFTFSPPGKPDNEGWHLEWRHFNGSAWVDVPDTGENGLKIVTDDTANFSRDGKVTFRNLPDLVFDEKSGARIACRLTGGTGRAHLPVIKRLTGEREVRGRTVEKPAEALFSAIHSGTAFIPLDPGGEFFPLGQRPERLDAFYIKVDDVYFDGEAKIEIALDMEGVPSLKKSEQLDNLEIEWAYSSEGGWNSVGKCTRNTVKEGSGHGFIDTTKAFTVTSSDSTQTTVTFNLARNKPRKVTKIGGKDGFWLRARVTGGGYGLDIEPATIWKSPAVYPPYIKNIRVTYSGFPDNSIPEGPVDILCGSVDGHAVQHAFSDDTQGGFSPFAGPCDITALYLGFSNPFPPGEWICLLLDVDEGRSADDTGTKLLWEYWNCRSENWVSLSVSDLSEGLNRRGYLGFYGPGGHGGCMLFEKEACWLRVSPHITPPVASAPNEKIVDCGTGDSASVSLDASFSKAADNLNISRYIWSRVPPVADAGTDPNAVVSGNAGPVTLDASRTTDGAGGKPSNARYTWRLLSSSHLAARAQVNIRADGQEATVVLDAGGSFTADGNPVQTYRWKKISSGIGDQGTSAPASGALHAKIEIAVLAGNGEASITLDASGSFSAGARPITRYIWREKNIEEKEHDQAAVNPFLNSVRCNTVPVANAFSVTEETLGSGNGKPEQKFHCLRRPVLPDIRVYVREPDEPSPAEMNTLQNGMVNRDDEDSTPALPATLSSDNSTWVLWRRVDHFFFSDSSSRHFVLDQAGGRIRFGDGIRGRIPPIGRDNIKAAFYRSHQGSAGNVAANEITVLRNPAGELVSIKRVTNPDACAGGNDTETVEEVRQRGPKALKHRGKSITTEDFAWLAREASGEIAAAWCIPASDARGKTREGWVTVVILPENRDTRPFPRPALLRLVRRYLEDRALVNLSKEGKVFVKGPEYLEVRACARIVPQLADKSDEVKLAVMNRLDVFFHPIGGGPQKKGWKLGRDVYLSEVYAEIEAVDGVDHVAGLRLNCSQQQLALCLAVEKPLSHRLPPGAIVGTFDEQIRYVLANGLEPEASDNAQHTAISPGPALTLQVCVFGFKTGDRVNVIDSAGVISASSVLIIAISAEGDAITLDMPVSITGGFLADFPPALLSTDERIRLPVAGWDEDGEGKTVARIKSFEADKDTVCIVFDAQRYSELQFLPVMSASTRNDRIVVPEGHLVCSGAHSVEMFTGE